MFDVLPFHLHVPGKSKQFTAAIHRPSDRSGLAMRQGTMREVESGGGDRLRLGVRGVESLNAYLGAGALQMSFTGLDATARSPWGLLFVRRLDGEDSWEDKQGSSPVQTVMASDR